MAGMPRRLLAPAAALSAIATAALALAACRTTTPTPPSPSSPISLAPGVFIMTAGVEHDVCGIGLIFTNIPADAQSPTADYAVLLSGPVGHVSDTVLGHTGDQPLPDGAVHPTHGVVVTLAGNRFGVNSVDGSSITLTALCAT
jgi:hypothetical protein